jgi:hypothetical protein
MNERDFTYWLQGFIEISQSPPTKEQWQIILDHLKLVTKQSPEVVQHGEAINFNWEDRLIC